MLAEELADRHVVARAADEHGKRAVQIHLLTQITDEIQTHIAPHPPHHDALVQEPLQTLVLVVEERGKVAERIVVVAVGVGRLAQIVNDSLDVGVHGEIIVPVLQNLAPAVDMAIRGRGAHLGLSRGTCLLSSSTGSIFRARRPAHCFQVVERVRASLTPQELLPQLPPQAPLARAVPLYQSEILH